MDKMS